MISSFLGLETGKGALQTTQQGLQTVGHNLANLNTEGYSRQRVTQTTTPPLFPPGITKPAMPGQIGTGVQVEEITRIRDIYLDNRIIHENGSYGFWDQKKTMLHQMESLMNEPNVSNIRSDLEAFFMGWQDVAENPSETAARINLQEKARTLSQSIKAHRQSLSDLQVQTDSLVNQKINQMNNIGATLADLNKQIQKQELLGDNPNDLRDKRDKLVDELSKFADIRLERNNPKEYIIYIGAEKFVQGEHHTAIEAYSDPDNKGFVVGRWQQTGQNINFGAGEISGLVEVRDVNLKEMLARTDSLAYGITDSVNSVHREGFNLNSETNINFFKELTLAKNAEGSFDFNKDGILDSTAFFRITGSEKLTQDTVIATGGVINLGPIRQGGADITVTYNATDTVGQVIERINRSDAQVTAYLDPFGRMSFRAQTSDDDNFPQMVLRHLEDSGTFLTGVAGVLQNSGAEGAFDWQNPDAIQQLRTPRDLISLSPDANAGEWMDIDEAILNKPEKIAAAQGLDTSGNGRPDVPTGINDNRNALALANLRYDIQMTGSAGTFAQYLEESVARVGSLSEQAIRSFDKTEAVSTNLAGLRTKISGVNVDEEMTKMLTLQHAYNAAARLVTVVDRLIDTVIRMKA